MPLLVPKPALTPKRSKNTHTKLKHNALNFWEVSAQAVALISPSMTAALIVPLMFGTAGTAGWLCYLFGTIMLLFVAISLNQFAKRYTSAGSMYEYTVKGLGPKIGGMSGWCLIFAYMFIGIAGVTGFTHFASMLLTQAGATGYLSHPYITLFAICVTLSWFLAYKDITFSTLLMLILEGVSVIVIMLLAMVALFKTGLVDTAQLHPTQGHGLVTSAWASSWRSSVLSVSNVLPPSAKRPRSRWSPFLARSSPAFWSPGAFFVFITYVETHALANNNPTLDQLTAPLTTLSQNLGMGWMGIVIEIGAMTSFFALAMSCMNAGSRIIFTMARYGIFPHLPGKQPQAQPHAALLFGGFRCHSVLHPFRIHVDLLHGRLGQGWDLRSV